MKNRCPKVLIVTGYGVNCEAESAYAWELAGARPHLMHLNDLLAAPRQLEKFQALMFIGGFSFGDHMGSGHVLALRWRHRMLEHLRRFLARKRLVLGVCNGFQVMVKLGLLPGLPPQTFEPQVALTHNQCGVFQNFWVTLSFDPKSPCVFTRQLDRLELPVRHGEGRFFSPDRRLLAEIERRNCVPCRYAHPRTGHVTMQFPHNPNGSQRAIAGLCTPDGLVFGLMPHPEAFLFPENHPQWPRRQMADEPLKHGLGLKIFKNAVIYMET